MSREIFIGKIGIGGKWPVSIQTMTNTDTRDVAATVSQINEVEKAGCEIVRLGIPDLESAEKIAEIKVLTRLPIVCDIHFDHRLALKCLEMGADKLRINPGNIGAEWKVREVAKACIDRGIPIRVGVNWGSVPEKDKSSGPPEEVMVTMAERNIDQLEKAGFEDIVISLKASNVPLMVKANRLFRQRYDFPLHLGVTEAGMPGEGTVKSAIGIGSLLLDGIGDTIRVSLTGNPVNEVIAAKSILKATGLRGFPGLNLVSCPTCARKRMDVEYIASQMIKRLSDIKEELTLAVMGCEVNGPGEAREADIGIAGTVDGVIIFVKGELRERLRGKIDESLLDEMERIIRDMSGEL